MILLIDNYDSFTFNLYQLIGELGLNVIVKRNNQVTIDEITRLSPQAIIISPGPGRPEDAGICIDIIQHFYMSIPILGICLGHQAISLSFGGSISRANLIMHGKTSFIKHSETFIFRGLPKTVEVMRYHSLVIDKESLPKCFSLLATSNDDKEIMAIKHLLYPVYGLQFHPESIGTKTGKQLLQNFFEMVKEETKNESVSPTII